MSKSVQKQSIFFWLEVSVIAHNLKPLMFGSWKIQQIFTQFYLFNMHFVDVAERTRWTYDFNSTAHQLIVCFRCSFQLKHKHFDSITNNRSYSYDVCTKLIWQRRLTIRIWCECIGVSVRSQLHGKRIVWIFLSYLCSTMYGNRWENWKFLLFNAFYPSLDPIYWFFQPFTLSFIDHTPSPTSLCSIFNVLDRRWAYTFAFHSWFVIVDDNLKWNEETWFVDGYHSFALWRLLFAFVPQYLKR